MAEVIYRTIEQSEAFARSHGYHFGKKQIVKAYPVVSPDRVVFQYYSIGDDAYRVVKIRPDKGDGKREFNNIASLVDHYIAGSYKARFNGVRMRELTRDYVGIDMPFLGYDLVLLALYAAGMSDQKFLPHSRSIFEGFTERKINQLISKLNSDHLTDRHSFAEKHKLIHGDLIHRGTPNNITYDPGYDRLFLLDAEALVPSTDDNLKRFQDSMTSIRGWMVENLIRS